ncbi:MAG: hypothetical protein BWX88_02683 [Planctomycetes bacterium ADurb.Bin126]|nr:MAG: hypothetical protein BWX88_02683 [Planctomycetes bacterium ADurb.Bin126]HOD79965.1 hypothetical protein [Phycisphaerae bacterium]HQL74022.1 hypothetical protein [Phycisphaerae bacterium]
MDGVTTARTRAASAREKLRKLIRKRDAVQWEIDCIHELCRDLQLRCRHALITTAPN